MNAKAFYDSHAATYDERHRNVRTDYMRSIEKALIKKFASGRVLDIGCGTGDNITNGGAGLDISSGMLREAKKKGHSVLVQGAAERLPFKNESFDSVICMFTVLNLCNYKDAVKEIRRVLKKGGTAIVSASSVWDNSKYGLVRRVLSRKKSRFMKMRIEKFRFKFFGFSKSNLIGAFGSFSLTKFYGIYLITKPFWGWHRDFSLKERIALKMAFALERLLQPFNRAAGMYFGIFRKV